MILNELMERMQGCADGNLVCDARTAGEALEALRMLQGMYCGAREQNHALRTRNEHLEEAVARIAQERDRAKEDAAEPVKEEPVKLVTEMLGGPQAETVEAQFAAMDWERRIMERALGRWGLVAQALKTNEEVGEFLTELNRNLLGMENLSHVAEELADAAIMLQQMEMGLGIEEQVAWWRKQKLLRLEVKLKKREG